MRAGVHFFWTLSSSMMDGSFHDMWTLASIPLDGSIRFNGRPRPFFGLWSPVLGYQRPPEWKQASNNIGTPRAIILSACVNFLSARLEFFRERCAIGLDSGFRKFKCRSPKKSTRSSKKTLRRRQTALGLSSRIPSSVRHHSDACVEKHLSTLIGHGYHILNIGLYLRLLENDPMVTGQTEDRFSIPPWPIPIHTHDIRTEQHTSVIISSSHYHIGIIQVEIPHRL